MKQLCAENNIELYFIPTPTKESRKVEIQEFDRKEMLGLLVENKLEYFLDNIKYLPDDQYIDKVHFEDDVIDINKNHVLYEMNKARTLNILPR